VTATIWQTCPSCDSRFEQTDDPGRKRVACSRACQQAAYRARQRTSAGQRHSAGQHTGRQDWRTGHQGQRRQWAGSQRPGAGQRHHQRQDEHSGHHEQRRPPPASANGQRPGATSGDDCNHPSRHHLSFDPAGWRSHNDTAVGCMVRSTTASSSVVKASRSTSWRRRALNRSIVLAAS
jgi:hypothetical protein